MNEFRCIYLTETTTRQRPGILERASCVSSEPTVLAVIRIVSRGTAAHAVDDDHEADQAGVGDEEGPPLLLYVSKEACLAGVAVVAQYVLLVAPSLAVTVGHGGSQLGDCPVGRILEVEPTLDWRLAAA